jgi:hypothetical protein
LNSLVGFSTSPNSGQRTVDSRTWLKTFLSIIANLDWNDDWVYTDDRLGLMRCDDLKFLGFLCEMLHPVVRPDLAETRELVAMFNQHLEADGYEICESGYISKRPIFAARTISIAVTISDADRITSDYVREQLAKCDAKLRSADYDGAITSARTLIEGVLAEIHERCTGTGLDGSGALLTDFKKVKEMLNLAEHQQAEESLKGLLRSLSSAIDGIDSLSNKLGDRHRRVFKPQRHHAKFVVDSAIAVSDFFYSTLEYQTNRWCKVRDELLKVLDESDIRFLSTEDLLSEPRIARLLSGSDTLIRRFIKNDLIKNYGVPNYRENDVYFAALRILLSDLEINDVLVVAEEARNNGQMIRWKGFREELKSKRPDFFQAAQKRGSVD